MGIIGVIHCSTYNIILFRYCILTITLHNRFGKFEVFFIYKPNNIPMEKKIYLHIYQA